MATTRKLTIAALRGTVWVRFQDITNNDMKFESICGGKISVERSASGTTYTVSSDIDHIRVFIDLVGPSDLPNLFYWDGGDTYGWWELEGYKRAEFGKRDLAAMDVSANALAIAELGDPKETNIW
jgi:hypothetical protein